MAYWILIGAALLGALAVGLGAFGAHALQGVLGEREQGWYDISVTYQTNHALAMALCGIFSIVAANFPTSRNACMWINTAGACFLFGIIVFSGSLYTMAFTGIAKLGMITPVGGLLLIIGWLCLAMGAFKLSSV
jgi:uncharacterized membrane protein YgdD (TMEM256/DUF423 family)